MWTESGCSEKKEVRKRWKFISGKNNQSQGNGGPWKRLPKKKKALSILCGRRWGRMILIKRDEWHNERRAGAFAVNILLSSPGAGLKRNFALRDMCFLLSSRTPRSLRRISSTMSPSRADCRTEWAAGWPEPTSCTAGPAGSTFRSWPTSGWTQTATMEPCMVGTAEESSFQMFH